MGNNRAVKGQNTAEETSVSATQTCVKLKLYDRVKGQNQGKGWWKGRHSVKIEHGSGQFGRGKRTS